MRFTLSPSTPEGKSFGAHPPIDTAPLPVAPGKWIYKAIYRVGVSPIGQWSAETSVTVGGWENR